MTNNQWKSFVPGFLGVEQGFRSIWLKVGSGGEGPTGYCRHVVTKRDGSGYYQCFSTPAEAADPKASFTRHDSLPPGALEI